MAGTRRSKPPVEDEDDDVLLTPEELAIRFKMHVDSIARWRTQDRGPAFIRIEGQVRYRVADVLKYEQENRT